MSMDRMETVPARQPMQSGDAVTPLLELRDVSKQYGLNKVLTKVCFHVGKAEIMALLGDNGAGKSTTVKTISGVVQPDSGELLWDGKPVALNSHADAAELGIETIYQDSALVDSMSIARNIFMGREMIGTLGFMRMKEMRDIAAHVLKTIVAIEGIDSPDKLVGSLSGGQKQAVAIARAVHFKRTLLVLDEPTSALSETEQSRLYALIERLKARLGVRPRLELVAEGVIPRTEFKARRVIDDRDLYRKGTGAG